MVGICASRLAERRLKPTVLIALDGPRGRGSGRSVPGFDLLAGLRAEAESLIAYQADVSGSAASLRLASTRRFREAASCSREAD